MSLTLNANLSALSAHRFTIGADSILTKSINRLSSGLRINSAADDPSGLSISQRLKTQYLGIERAVMNSQDAISYLQTAESALNETQNILQRMRELSVQASNGTLTASDRQEVQKEISQLTEEIDRIAKSTEYNTKKLLDGSAAALWSSSSDQVRVVVRGKVAEGNYELEIDTDPVANHVLKTDIFKVKTAAQAVANVDLGATQATYVPAGGTNASSGTLSFDFGNGIVYSLAVNAGVTQATLAATIAQDDYLNDYIRTYVDYATVASGALTFQAIKAGVEGNAYSVTADVNNVGFVSSGLAHAFTGGNDYPSGVTGVANPTGIPAATAIASTYNVWVDNVIAVGAADTATIVASYEQPIGEIITAATTAGALSTAITTVVASSIITAPEGSGYAIVEVIQGGVAGIDEIKARVSFDKGQTWYMTNDLGNAASAVLTDQYVTDGTSQFAISVIAAAAVVNKGDKVLVALNDRNFNAASHAELRIDTPFVNGLGGAEQAGPRWAFATDALNNKTTKVTVGYLDTNSGDINFGSIDINIETLDSDSAVNPELTALETDNLITFNVTGAGGPAYGTTKLWQVDRFYDVNGNFILGEHGKYLTIYNSVGSKSEIYIDPEDTVQGLSDKIEKAITGEISNGGLGMGTGDAAIDGHVCDFISEAVPNTDEALKGTMIIRSPWMGEGGKLVFSAEEELLKALSLVTINTPDRDPMTITVRNAHTGDLVGTTTVADATVHNVIQGVDVELNANTDVDINWDSASRKFIFSNANGTVKEYIHIVDNAKSFQIGASQGQTMDSFVSEMTAHALKADAVMVVDQGMAQKAMTTLSEAIDRVSSERSRIGAVINRLDHTIKNLELQKESAVSSFSRIVDLDVAKESVEFSKAQMMVQASQAMLAQANRLPANLLQLLR